MFVFGKFDVLVLDVINLQCCFFLFGNVSENGLNLKNGPYFENGLNFRNGLIFENV
jgi:hypothetical protein